MKTAVQVRVAGQIVGRDGVGHPLEDAAHLFDFGIGGASRGSGGDDTFERTARFEDQERLIQGKGAYACAPIGLHLDQSLLGQANEYPTERGPTDAEPLGNVDLDQPLARGVDALFDIRAQPSMGRLEARDGGYGRLGDNGRVANVSAHWPRRRSAPPRAGLGCRAPSRAPHVL